MTGLLRRFVGETLESRFVFFISVVVSIALTAVIVVVLRQVNDDLLAAAGSRTTVVLLACRSLLQDRPVVAADRTLRELNASARPDGATLYMTLTGDPRTYGLPTSAGPVEPSTVPASHLPLEVRFGGDRWLAWSVPVTLEGGVTGRVVMGTSMRFLNDRLWLLVTKLLLLASSLIIVSYFLARILAGRVLGPLRRFTTGMERVAKGEYPPEEVAPESVEMGRWADTFNVMVAQLREKHIMERLLFQREKLASVGHLAASVAHEIRNPLASISSLTQLIAKRHGEDVKLQEYTHVVLKEVDRLNVAIHQLLTFARPAPAKFEACSIVEVLDSVLLLLGFEARQNGVRLVRDFDLTGQSPVWADPNQLKQVFINLVSNAFQALGRGGEVTVGLRFDPAADRALVQVRDTGDGIPADALDRIFEPFFSTRTTGVGLGLAISRRIVDDHGGEIRVESPGEGRGATFSVGLPCGTGAEAAPRLAAVGATSPRVIR